MVGNGQLVPASLLRDEEDVVVAPVDRSGAHLPIDQGPVTGKVPLQLPLKGVHEVVASNLEGDLVDGSLGGVVVLKVLPHGGGVPRHVPPVIPGLVGAPAGGGLGRIEGESRAVRQDPEVGEEARAVSIPAQLHPVDISLGGVAVPVFVAVVEGVPLVEETDLLPLGVAVEHGGFVEVRIPVGVVVAVRLREVIVAQPHPLRLFQPQPQVPAQDRVHLLPGQLVRGALCLPPAQVH